MSAKSSAAITMTVAVVLAAGILSATSARAQNGYLAAAEVGQVEDVVGQVLTIDNGTNEAQQQARDGQSSPGCLTNDDIIKLVQAKLPDSVVIAKIKSSTCEFDTTTDALIKLKGAGASDPVLQAFVEPPPPSEPT